MDINKLSNRIIGAAIEVHKTLGPGFLESAYEECICHELNLGGFSLERQKPLAVQYKGMTLDCGYRLDVVVENAIILELVLIQKRLFLDERGQQSAFSVQQKIFIFIMLS